MAKKNAEPNATKQAGGVQSGAEPWVPLSVPEIRDVDVILIDLANPHVDAAELVQLCHSQFPLTPIVLVSALATRPLVLPEVQAARTALISLAFMVS